MLTLIIRWSTWIWQRTASLSSFPWTKIFWRYWKSIYSIEGERLTIGSFALYMVSNSPEAVIITHCGTTVTKEAWNRRVFIVSDTRLRKVGDYQCISARVGWRPPPENRRGTCSCGQPGVYRLWWAGLSTGCFHSGANPEPDDGPAGRTGTDICLYHAWPVGR